LDERRGPSAMMIFALPKPGFEPSEIRHEIMAEINSIATDGPSPEEMSKLKNGLLNDVVRSRQSSQFRAQRIAEYTLYDNDPSLFNTELGKYLEVTADQIRKAVAKYMVTDNRVVLEIIPAQSQVAEAA
jgi:predicted Zn-dependent peptidase